MPTAHASSYLPLPQPSSEPPCGLTIRAREPGDWQELADLMQLPKVRWGTMRLPFRSREEVRKFIETPAERVTCLVALLDGRLVGHADVTQYPGRRSHVGSIGLIVHDDFHGRGIGSALLATLVDVADNWLNLRRLELVVYVDNEPAIRLYRKAGFEVEGTKRAEAFRAGAFADAYLMARLRGI
jgi:L-phenylalanine/L-methionine N-acetyltransferase